MAFINSLLSAPAGRRIAHIIADHATPFKPTHAIEEWQKNLGHKMVQ
jgi:hypothetical protein